MIKPKRQVHTVFIHCSASDNIKHDDISVIKEWHVKGNKWSDVGYHYFIKKNGTVQEGRPLSKNPASQYPHNTGTISICVSGLQDFTDESMEALKKLCGEINSVYNSNMVFRGHREVSNKTCPVFDYKTVLNLNDKGHIKPKEVICLKDTKHTSQGLLQSLAHWVRGLLVK